MTNGLAVLTTIGICTAACALEAQDSLAVRDSTTTADIRAALGQSGLCTRKVAQDSWAYEAFPPGHGVAIITKLRGASQINIGIVTAHATEQGSVHLDQRAVFWFDSREHQVNGKTVAQVTETIDEARAEWATPRGQELVQLAAKAQSACDRAPLSTVHSDST